MVGTFLGAGRRFRVFTQGFLRVALGDCKVTFVLRVGKLRLEVTLGLAPGGSYRLASRWCFSAALGLGLGSGHGHEKCTCSLIPLSLRLRWATADCSFITQSLCCPLLHCQPSFSQLQGREGKVFGLCWRRDWGSQRARVRAPLDPCRVYCPFCYCHNRLWFVCGHWRQTWPWSHPPPTTPHPPAPCHFPNFFHSSALGPFICSRLGYSKSFGGYLGQ